MKKIAGYIVLVLIVMHQVYIWWDMLCVCGMAILWIVLSIATVITSVLLFLLWAFNIIPTKKIKIIKP